MSHRENTEIERKYEVGEDTPLPALPAEAVPGVAEVAAEEPFELEALYFDTADLALARARIALRRRRGGHDEGWHVKLPAVEGRTELQWPLGEDTGEVAVAVPEQVLDAVRVHVRDRPVTPLARIRTTRRVSALRAEGGALLVEIADDAVTTTDLREGTTRAWREWEAELGPAAPGSPEERAALLDTVEGHLLAAGATVSPSVSKLAQALGRTGLGGSETPVGVAGQGDPAADVVRAGVGELVRRLIELDPAVRADAPEAVHRFRTTVRRVRSALATNRRLFDRAEVEALRDSLARLGAVLGEVRDLEVQAEAAEHALDAIERDRGADDPDARRRLVDDTRAERAEAHRRLVAALGRVPYFRLLDGLEAFAAGGGADGTAPRGSTPVKTKTSGRAEEKAGKAAARRKKDEAKRSVAREGRRALRRSVTTSAVREELGAGTAETAAALAALHASRTSARRLRLAAEFAAEGPTAVLGSGTARLADRAEELQDALGAHRDASLFAEFALLNARRADAAGESSFTYGVLYQRALDTAARSLEEAERARRRLKRSL